MSAISLLTFGLALIPSTLSNAFSSSSWVCSGCTLYIGFSLSKSNAFCLISANDLVLTPVLPLPPLGPWIAKAFTASLVSVNNLWPTMAPPSTLPNSLGIGFNKSSWTVSALVISFGLNPLFFSTTLIDSSLNPSLLPCSTILSIDKPVLKAASGFFSIFICLSVILISWPAKISASATPKNLSSDKSWISSALRSADLVEKLFLI